jgi:hypothetical protein
MGKPIAIVIAFTLAMAVASSALASDKPEFGLVRLPKDMTIEIRCAIEGDGEPAVLLDGGYNLFRWSIRRTDKEGVPWTCEGFVPDDKNVIKVVPGQMMELPVGEPLVSTLTATRQGAEIRFSHELLGRLGERVEIKQNGKQSPAPKLRIRNGDGSYDRSLTFQYG